MTMSRLIMGIYAALVAAIALSACGGGDGVPSSTVVGDGASASFLSAPIANTPSSVSAICGVGLDRNIWCASKNTLTNPAFTSLTSQPFSPSRAAQVVMNGTNIVAIDLKGNISYATDFRTPAWISWTNQKLKSISMGADGTVCGSDTNNGVFCARGGWGRHLHQLVECRWQQQRRLDDEFGG